MCFDIVEIWFGITNAQISSIFASYVPVTHLFFQFRTITSKCQWIFTKLGVCIGVVKVWFGIANGQVSSIFDRVIGP